MRLLPVLGSALVSAATALALVAAVVALFLSPAWVAFEQGRADAAGWTGYGPTDLRTATDAILADLVLGPPDFDVRIGREAVLTEPERAHMRDVRGVFTGFYALAAAAAVMLAIGWWTATRPGAWNRDRYWRAVRRGSLVLSGTIGIAGVVALVAFDAAFELFHGLLFRSGTYDFDPRTYRLTQLFPDAFWSETTLVAGAAILVVAVGVAVVTTRRLRAPDCVAAMTGAVAGAGR